MYSTALKGALLAGSMIVAIGSQNAYLLKSGLNNNRVVLVATICFVGDVLLMTSGIFGLSSLISTSEILTIIISAAGSIFLLWYGVKSLISACKGQNRIVLDNTVLKPTLLKTIMAASAITFLNPHVYLDTVVIVGGMASTLQTDEKFWFLTGALISSFTWFYGLAYTSKKLTPFFSKPSTWRTLDFIIAIIMFYIAFDIIGSFLI